MFTIEPTDHWRVGDRAYCLRTLKRGGQHVVERGRIYTVTAVLQMRGMMSDGLHLDGVDRGKSDGFWSNRFVCLRGRQLPHRQIAERTSHSWYEAYRATADARAAQAIEARRVETPKSGSIGDESAVA